MVKISNIPGLMVEKIKYHNPNCECNGHYHIGRKEALSQMGEREITINLAKLIDKLDGMLIKKSDGFNYSERLRRDLAIIIAHAIIANEQDILEVKK